MEFESDYRDEATPMFEQTFIVLPFSKYKTPHLESGDKIILPQSSLSQVVSARLEFPLLFKVESHINDKRISSHCGVLEFEAEEGFMHMPGWMMKNLKLQEGNLVNIRNASLSKGTYIKLQPHETAFTQVPDHKAMLEKTLSNFTCLSKSDTFVVKYNETKFNIDVLEVRPGDAVCLIDTECEVDFAMPLDHKDPERPKEKVNCKRKFEKSNSEEERKGFRVFTGKSRRLDGEFVALEKDECAVVEDNVLKPGDAGFLIDTNCKADLAAPLDYTEPALTKEKQVEKKIEKVYNSCCVDEKKEEAKEFRPFTGEARRLDGEAVTVESRRFAAVIEGLAKIGIQEKQDCKKKRGKEKFKAFTGRSYVTGLASMNIC